ncbi:Peptidoglycan/LPS O-acetylase OafA/YrhL, contains acyltransferase and SGNH-hydrolase domains [Virgibacillus subterraneus]|uniref:Peptidoglycan/LPS O-acetylase OafA/YrhL, contains acyltransferase and SGNH-hydrolase domains n=1 Tax=Virgibacillus subterraneus TaxID=621109 RepID=A0A1H9EDZ9_9BACI|nr:acyltransferase [Virgibacillus subterraneus]SEQ23869.1 Peptidoglycan/LPS O-acetylase OafA/YrhL, contains acyltransferase and SGNH-hydrolase domains [Virgibacillus subterraneus]
MFGTFRYLLAIFVVWGHLSPFPSKSGGYAVFGFYILSGFLMALTLNKTYGFTLKGTKNFLTNRALRIFPPYLAVLLFSVFVVSLAPTIAHTLNVTMSMPESFAEWFKNLVILGLNNDAQTRLVPPAWSLHVELSFYIMMALILARSKKIVTTWFILSTAFTVFMVFAGFDYQNRYFPVYAASLPFSIGAMIYYYKDKLTFTSIPVLITLLTIYILHSGLATLVWNDPGTEGFYFSLIITVLIIISLLNINKSIFPTWARKTDSFLGDLSYSIFLCHWPVAAFVTWIFLNGDTEKRLSIFLLSFLISHILAIIINLFIEKNVQKIRNRVRGNAQTNSNTASRNVS